MMHKIGKERISIVSKTFFDTNILIYQLDKRYPEKLKACRQSVEKIALNGEGVISTQIVQEFYVVATVKLHIDPVLVKSIIHTFENLEVVIIDKELISAAIDVNLQHHFSFWDSLVIVAAESAKCEFLYSEDMNHGQKIRNVKIINPMI